MHEQDVTSLVDPYHISIEPPDWLLIVGYNMASPLQYSNYKLPKRLKYFIIPNTVINNINTSTTSTQQVYNNVRLICYNVREEMRKIHRYDTNVLIQLQHIFGLTGQSSGRAQYHTTIV
jgi:hypothetical protein